MKYEEPVKLSLGEINLILEAIRSTIHHYEFLLRKKEKTFPPDWERRFGISYAKLIKEYQRIYDKLKKKRSEML